LYFVRCALKDGFVTMSNLWNKWLQCGGISNVSLKRS